MKLKRVAVIGGLSLNSNGKWVELVAAKLSELKAGEVITSGGRGGAEIGIKASWDVEVPNVIIKAANMVEKADVLITMPGASSNTVKAFRDAGKQVIEIKGDGR